MNLSEFAFKIILIFIPGLITFNIVEKLTFHREFKTPKILFGSLAYGFLCYLSYGLLFFLTPVRNISPVQELYFLQGLSDPQVPPNFWEIGFASFFSIPVGFVSAAWINFRCLYWIARKLKVSDKLDDIGVWNKALGSSLGEWIVIRDYKEDLMYRGWVDSVSEGLDVNEILLRDVDVYVNSTPDSEELRQKHLYHVPRLYFSLRKDDFLVIEIWTEKAMQGLNDENMGEEGKQSLNNQKHNEGDQE